MAALIMTVVLIVFNRRKGRGMLYIVVLHYREEAGGDEIRRAMGTLKYRVKSKTLRGEITEMALEVYASNKSLVFAEKLRAIEGVEDVTLIQYDGEYHE